MRLEAGTEEAMTEMSCELPKIAWDGSKQIFSFEQLSKVDKLLKFKPSDQQCNKIVKIFVPDIDRLISIGYVKHHRDGNHWNNYPINIMVVLRSAHTRWHLKNMSQEARVAKRNVLNVTLQKRWDDMSQEEREADHITKCKSQQKRWDDMSGNDKQVHGRQVSSGNGGMRIRGMYFIETCPEPFDVAEFNEVAGYAYTSAAHTILSIWVKEGKVELTDKQATGAGPIFIYRSLICEVS